MYRRHSRNALEAGHGVHDTIFLEGGVGLYFDPTGHNPADYTSGPQGGVGGLGWGWGKQPPGRPHPCHSGRQYNSNSRAEPVAAGNNLISGAQGMAGHGQSVVSGTGRAVRGWGVHRTTPLAR